MHEMGGGAFSEDALIAEDQEGSGVRRDSGNDGVLEQLARLEERVESVVGGLRALREERDRLREEIAERDGRIADLEERTARSSGLDETVGRLTDEKSSLLEDRVRVMHRVESILARLNQLGVD